MARETIRYDADTIWIRYGCDATRYDIRCTIRIRYGYGATRYDTLVRDNDGSLPPDRVREPIIFYLTTLSPLSSLSPQPRAPIQRLSR